jgi:hypothetical protein
MNQATYDKVYKNAGLDLDFATLDARAGFTPTKGDSALETWYRATQKTKISGLSDRDLARALRQGVHVPLTTRAAVMRLQSDPWRGELYPGELAAALGDVEMDDWIRLDAQTTIKAREIADKLAKGDEAPAPETLAAFDRLRRRTTAALLHGELVIVKGATADGLSRYSLSPDNETTIGKHADNRLQIKGAERHHLRVKLVDRGYVVMELGHRGATVSGKAISSDGRGERALVPGDVIQVGEATLRYEARNPAK